LGFWGFGVLGGSDCGGGDGVVMEVMMWRLGLGGSDGGGGDCDGGDDGGG